MDPRPAVADLEVLPPAVAALPNVEFALRVQLRGEYGALLPDSRASEVDWQPGTHLTDVRRVGPEIVVKGDPATLSETSPPSFPLPTKVTATANQHSRNADVTLIADGASAGMDWAEVAPAPGASPVIALVDGLSGTWRNDTAIAFAAEGVLGDYRQSGNSGRVALFSSHHQVGYVDASWTNGPDLVSFSRPPTMEEAAFEPTAPALTREVLGPPLVEALGVWIAATGANIAATVREDIEHTYRVFREARSGITFDTTIGVAYPTSVTLDVVGPNWTCPTTVRDDLVAAGVPSAEFASWRTIVVYVTHILEPGDGEESGASGARGYACPADATHGIILLVSWAARVHSTLAHELGHGLSQWGPPLFGHTNPPTFDAANLMRPFEADDAPVSRGRLSLGQSFQMSVDTRALVNASGRRAGKTETCQSNPDAVEPCPRLAKDVP